MHEYPLGWRWYKNVKKQRKARHPKENSTESAHFEKKSNAIKVIQQKDCHESCARQERAIGITRNHA